MSRKKKKRSKRASSQRHKSNAVQKPKRVETPVPQHLQRSVAGLILVAVASLLAFLIYSNSLHGPFLFDDTNNIRDNAAIKITSIDGGSLLSAGFDSPHPRRFVAYISFALNYYFHQDQTFGYHLVNILIHLVTSLLVYQFATLTLSLPLLKSRYPRGREIALFVALLWLSHPMAAQSVAYLVQRMNSLATMFYLASMVCYVQGRLAAGNRRLFWFIGCTVCAVGAFGSKEIAVTLPFFMLLYEWFFLRDMDKAWLQRSLPWIAVLVVVVIAVGLIATQGKPFAAFDGRTFTLTERLLTQGRVVVFYLSLLVLPHPSRLTINHDIAVSHGLADPVTTLGSLMLVFGLVAIALWSARRERLLAFCILWYFGHLVVESSVLPLELIFEHRTYLPSIGPIILGVAMFYRFTARFKYQFAPLVILLLVWSWWAHERSQVWSDKVSFWSDAVEKSPNVARVYNNLGVAYEERREFDEAMAQYRKAYSLDPGLYRALNNIGSIHLEREEYDEALRAFNRSREIDPRDVDAYKGLALTYHAMGDRRKYREYLTKVRAMEGQGG